MTSKITADEVRRLAAESWPGHVPAPRITSEADFFLVEAATQRGFIHLDDDAETLTVTVDDFVAFVRMVEAGARKSA